MQTNGRLALSMAIFVPTHRAPATSPHPNVHFVIQLRPVLLGQGRRLFDGLPAEHIELRLTRTIETPDTMHLRYAVLR